MSAKHITISILLISYNLIGQNLEKQFQLANSLFGQENYFDAVTEYKRLLFFDKSNKFDYKSYFNIGLSYKYGAKYDNAIKHFRLSELVAKVDTQKVESQLQIVRVNILRRTTDEAISLLNELQINPGSGIDSNTISYWRGWSFIMADEWETAAEEFNKIDIEHPLKKLCLEIEGDKYSVTFATLISYILPGSGQIYTGNYVSGFLSLGWNVLWGYLTINAFITDRVFEGLLMGGLLWARFYRGNIQNAEKLAIEENIKISNKGYRYLKNNYRGIKP